VEEVPVVVEEAKMDKKDEEDEDSEEYKDKKKKEKMKEEKKSEVDFEPILSAIGELKSLLTPKSEAPHPLDEVLAKFRTDYDAVQKMVDVTPDEKLQLIQQSFAEIGNAVVDTIKKSQAEEPKPQEVDAFAQFSQALEKINQRFDMIEAKLSVPTQQIVTEDRPMLRRSVQMPARTQIEQRSVMTPATPDNPTPKLHELLRRTV
jgi:hypothetical protein